MNIAEFFTSHNLHDSLLENIIVDKVNKSITLVLDYCYWQQKDYQADQMETGLVKLEFEGVSSFHYLSHPINSDQIIQWVLVDKDTLLIETISDLTGDCHTLQLSAASVSFSPAET